MENKAIKEFKANSENQISAFMMDHLKPITMRQHWDTALKVDFYIKPLIRTIELIMEIGELEHTGDWDPAILIEFHDTTDLPKLETGPGYYLMQVQGNTLLLEDSLKKGDQEDGSVMEHRIDIQDIYSITLIRH